MKKTHSKAAARTAMPKSSHDWEVKDAVSTLRRAEAIKADSKLYAQVRLAARDEAKQLVRIAGRCQPPKGKSK